MLACFSASAAGAEEAEPAAEAVEVAAALCVGSVLECLEVLESTPGPTDPATADAPRMLSLSEHWPLAGIWASAVAAVASEAAEWTK